MSILGNQMGPEWGAMIARLISRNNTLEEVRLYALIKLCAIVILSYSLLILFYYDFFIFYYSGV